MPSRHTMSVQWRLHMIIMCWYMYISIIFFSFRTMEVTVFQFQHNWNFSLPRFLLWEVTFVISFRERQWISHTNWSTKETRKRLNTDATLRWGTGYKRAITVLFVFLLCMHWFVYWLDIPYRSFLYHSKVKFGDSNHSSIHRSN